MKKSFIKALSRRCQGEINFQPLASATVLALILTASCEKKQLLVEKQNESSTPELSSSGIIESEITNPSTPLLEAIASIKYQAGRIPSTDGPDPSYTAPDLGNLSVKESIYYIEASLNFDHYKEIESQVDFETFTDDFTLPLISGISGDSIDQDDIVDAYDDLYDIVNNNKPSGKDVLICNVYATSINTSDVDFEIVVTYSVTGTITELDANDDWWALNGAGKCDNSNLGLDATDRLEELANWYRPEGWNGSTAGSTGPTAIGCPNNQSSAAWHDVYTMSYGNTSFTVWPWYGCAQTCLSDSDMEAELDGYFDHTPNVVSTPFDLIYVDYYDKPNTLSQEPCWTTSLHGGHAVDWTMGELECGPLPW